ncbi:hypothetical protein [Rhodococcus qingshengii]|uniref:hypothetical protein n=1 Tax=Rhodococcus qingshengii TaxID=334542 RepID=UPI00071C1F00|nr:hypothetical protein [Rhodococcus qingshengii]SCC37426.1 hypothetical protein GA0061093_107153 [Rhodococcus qingshengii]
MASHEQLSTSRSALQINDRIMVDIDLVECEYCRHETYVDPVCAMGALLSIIEDETLASEAVLDLVVRPLMHAWNQRADKGIKILGVDVS